MADHYRKLAHRVTPELAEYIRVNAKDLQGGGDKTSHTSEAKKQFQGFLEAKKPDM